MKIWASTSVAVLVLLWGCGPDVDIDPVSLGAASTFYALSTPDPVTPGGTRFNIPLEPDSTSTSAGLFFFNSHCSGGGPWFVDEADCSPHYCSAGIGVQGCAAETAMPTHMQGLDPHTGDSVPLVSRFEHNVAVQPGTCFQDAWEFAHCDFREVRLNTECCTDGQCEDAGRPHCENIDTNTCVECLEDSHCATSETCSNNECVEEVEPPTVEILGPEFIYPGDTCTWTAQAAGGQPGYTYSWYRGSTWVGSGSSYMGGVPNGSTVSHFTLHVQIQDQLGTFATDSIFVEEDDEALLCPSF